MAVFVIYYAAGGDVYDVIPREDKPFPSTVNKLAELKDLIDLVGLKPGVIDNIPVAAEYDARLNIALNPNIDEAHKQRLYAVLDKATYLDRFEWVEILPPPQAGIGAIVQEYNAVVPVPPPPLFQHYVDP